MRKPWWVRAIAWSGWVSMAIFGYSFYLWMTGGRDPNAALTGTVFLFVALALFAVWAVVSFIFKAIGWNARAQADRAAMTLQGLSRAGPPIPIGAAAARGPDAWDNPPTKIRCDVCGRFHALLVCFRHHLFLCFPCCAKHDEEACRYVAAGRRVDEAHKEPPARREPGKVLGI